MDRRTNTPTDTQTGATNIHFAEEEEEKNLFATLTAGCQRRLTPILLAALKVLSLLNIVIGKERVKS